MPDILANPNALPARADMQVRSDGILDLANFVAEVVPAPDSVLASLGGDLREYGMLRRDDQVAALMQQRQDKLVEAEWEVIPGGDAPADVAAADFLREQLTGFNFDAACRKMHGSLLYGYGVAECLWGRDGSRITLRDIRVRAPWRFGFAKDRQLKLLVESRWLAMPPRKFWLVTWGAEDDDNPYGMGLGHQLWWPVYLKRNGARFWAAYLDRFGVPTTKAVYPSDESDAENEKRKKDALAAALSLRSEGAVALPEGFDVSLVESTSRGSGDFKDFLAYWDDAIAKIILSQTGTSRIGQYSGTAEVHSGIGTSVVKADADTAWLTEGTFPGQTAPDLAPGGRPHQSQADQRYGGLAGTDRRLATVTTALRGNISPGRHHQPPQIAAGPAGDFGKPPFDAIRTELDECHRRPPFTSFPRPALRATTALAYSGTMPGLTIEIGQPKVSAPAWSRLTRICCASLSIPARRSG